MLVEKGYELKNSGRHTDSDSNQSGLCIGETHELHGIIKAYFVMKY